MIYSNIYMHVYILFLILDCKQPKAVKINVDIIVKSGFIM